jgi:hypothetical protein
MHVGLNNQVVHQIVVFILGGILILALWVGVLALSGRVATCAYNQF